MTTLRKFLLILLLPSALAFAPGLASATTYKCVSKGVTTYSQEPCGKDAQKVDTKDALSGVGVPTPVPPPGSLKTPAPVQRPAAKPAKPADDNSCAAKMKAYQESLACFAPYRHSANVIDVEAYKHCKVVAEPDCN